MGQATLTRFFMMHVIFLPLTLLVLCGVHFWRIRKDGGLSRPAAVKKEETEKIYSWPILMWTELAILLGIAAVLVLLAFFIDAPLLEHANPAHPENLQDLMASLRTSDAEIGKYCPACVQHRLALQSYHGWLGVVIIGIADIQ